MVTANGPANGTAFQLDSGASEIWLFLHADGPLAKVGHTHVITNHDLRGTVWLHPQPEQSACEVQIPVQSFVVDDPKERASAGAEYAEPLDEAARSGTRDHMLGDKQLSAAQYPSVSLQCRHIAIGAQGRRLSSPSSFAITPRSSPCRCNGSTRATRCGRKAS